MCRLWAETFLPGDSHPSGYYSDLAASQHSVKCAASSKKKRCNGKIDVNPGQEVSYSQNVLLLMITILALNTYSELYVIITLFMFNLCERHYKEVAYF